MPWNYIGKGGVGYLETILERRGLYTLKQYWKGGVWVPWNYIVKARFGYLETILERWDLDALQQYWKGGVWIPPELKDNLNSSLSFGQAAPMVCLSDSIACLLACLRQWLSYKHVIYMPVCVFLCCTWFCSCCTCPVRVLLVILSLFQVATSCPCTMMSPDH